MTAQDKDPYEAGMLEVTCYRATFPDRAALDIPDVPARASMRFHAAGEEIPAYTSIHPPDGPIWELERQVGASLAGATLRLTTLSFRGIAFDITVAPGRLAAGVSEADLVVEDFAATHRVAAYVKRMGADAVVAPSAAVVGGKSLIVWHPAIARTLTVEGWELIKVPPRAKRRPA